MKNNTILRFTIRRKLMLGFVLVIVLATVIGSTALITNLMQTTALKQEEAAMARTRLAKNIESQLFRARRQEKDYLLRYEVEGLLAAHENYVLPFQAHIAAIQSLIAQLRDDKNLALAETLDLLEAEVSNYKNYFLAVEDNIQDQGDATSGLEGNFRSAAQAIDTEFENNIADDSLLVLQLTIRSYEKEYLRRRDAQSIKDTHTAIDTFNAVVENSETLNPGQQIVLLSLSDAYRFDFDALVAKNSEIDSGLNSLTQAATTIETLTDSILTQSELERLDAAASANKVINLSQLILVITLIITGASGSLAAHFLGRSITLPLVTITDAAQAIAGGNLETEVDIHRSDEIGVLATSLNAMTYELHSLIERESTARYTLEDTVMAYSEFIESVAQGELAHRLRIQDTQNKDDPMIQLGLNLNKMVDGLQDLTRRLEDSAEGDRRARKNLQNTVADYRQFVGAVTNGDLTRRLELNPNGIDNEDANNELLALGYNLNQMVSSLAHMAGQTKELGATIAAAVTEILAATTEQLAAKTEQDATLAQTSATAGEVQVTVTQTAKRAENLASTAQRSVEASQRGQEAVNESIDGMRRIRYQVEGIAENILALAERTQQIGDIINSVNDIAEQSKVLSLNASIEAARAGEEGKSFAVVAMEVRNLADQSREATDQVREILNEIQQATNASVMATEEGIKGVDHGERLINQAGLVIQELAGVIQEAAQASAQIASSSHQQTIGMDQLTAAMESFLQTSLQITTRVQQAERSAQGLNEMARQMQEAVEQYRLVSDE